MLFLLLLSFYCYATIFTVNKDYNNTLLLARHQLRASVARRAAWRGRGQPCLASVGVVTR